MTHEEQCDHIDKHVDKRVEVLEGRFDHHLEIYANNGKELKALKETVADSVEKLVQQISAVGSDVKKLQIDFGAYASKVQTLETDKTRRDGWIDWFLKSVFGIVIIAILLSIGIKMK